MKRYKKAPDQESRHQVKNYIEKYSNMFSELSSMSEDELHEIIYEGNQLQDIMGEYDELDDLVIRIWELTYKEPVKEHEGQVHCSMLGCNRWIDEAREDIMYMDTMTGRAPICNECFQIMWGYKV